MKGKASIWMISLMLLAAVSLTGQVTANQQLPSVSQLPCSFPYCPPPSPIRHKTYGVEFVSHRGGATHTVVTRDGYAYVGIGARLVILDISDPYRPRRLGQTGVLPGIVYDITVVGNYAYLAAGEAGLGVIDIADRTSPVEIGTFSQAGNEAKGIAIAGHYVYVADTGYNTFSIYDVTDPANPVRTEFHSDDIAGYPTNVRIYEDHAYIMASNLSIFNLTNPISPTFASNLSPTNLIKDVAFVENYAYLAGNGLSIYDITDPNTLELIGEWNKPATGTFNQAVAIVGNYAYLPDSFTNRLRTIDISNPYTPTEVGSYALPRPALDVALADSYVYAASDEAGLYVFDASNPAGLTVTSIYSIPTNIATSPPVVIGDYEYRVYDIYQGWDLKILDVSDPSEPKEVGSYLFQGAELCFPVADLAVAGSHAYVVDNLTGLHVLDVMTPTAITQVYTDSEPAAYAVATDEDYVYVGSGGVRILDTADPTDLREIGAYDTVGVVDEIVVEKNFIYALSGEAGLFTLWFSPPVSTTIPTSGGTLVSPRDQTVHIFPSGLFTSTAVITHTPQYPDNSSLTSNLIHIGHTFEITGTLLNSTKQPVQPSQPYTITIHYTEAEKGAAIENTLALHSWNGTEWQKELTSVVDAETNTITAFPSSFSQWAVLGEVQRAFLPYILRNY